MVSLEFSFYTPVGVLGAYLVPPEVETQFANRAALLGVLGGFAWLGLAAHHLEVPLFTGPPLLCRPQIVLGHLLNHLKAVLSTWVAFLEAVAVVLLELVHEVAGDVVTLGLVGILRVF